MEDPASNGVAAEPTPVKRKRGRPPKNPKPAADTPAAVTPAAAEVHDEGQPVKRKRGRPPGSKNKNLAAQETDAHAAAAAAPSAAASGGGSSNNIMYTHVLTVNVGEDVYDKLRELSRTTRRSVVVLAATGTLSAATLMQLNSSGQGVGVTLRGHFTILAISGALLQSAPSGTETKRQRATQREPGEQFLSASLANPSGGVVGGTVAGPLESASPVTLVCGLWEPQRTTSGPAADGADPQMWAAHFAAAAPMAMLGGGLGQFAGLPGMVWPGGEGDDQEGGAGRLAGGGDGDGDDGSNRGEDEDNDDGGDEDEEADK